MADLTDKEASQSVKISGQDSSGLETYQVGSHSDGSLKSYSPGFSTPNNAVIAVGNSSTLLIAANVNRKMAYVSNLSGVAIWIRFGDAAVLNRGIRLLNGSYYQIDSNNFWQGDVYAIKSGGGTLNIDVFEGT
jgi:hypothetical protein